MEEKKQMGSSSSFTTELFGSKDSYSASSKGIFGSLFAPSTKIPDWAQKGCWMKAHHKAHHEAYHGAYLYEEWSIEEGVTKWVLGRESLRSGTGAGGSKKQHVYEDWNTKSGLPDNATRGSKGESLSVPKKETTFVYQEERAQQPCHLSSSIFYGGQDNFYRPQSSQSSGSQSNYGNDDGQDYSGHASRGDWWQGSLYY